MKIEEIYSRFLSSTSIATDTRKITQGSLFVALKGDNFNANAFAAEALDKGAAYAIIDDVQYHTHENMILVNNSLKTLQQLATHHRRQLGLPIIALTGSNGKTTTKELINVVLSSKYNAKATVGNLNNHIGVPLTLLSFTKDTEIGIVEMGANHQKEIEMLCEIAEPNFGYITNFGKAHLEGFGGAEGVIKGKSELYAYLEKNTKMAFINLDDPIQQEKSQHLARYTFATGNYNCDVRIEEITANPIVTVKYSGMAIASNMIGIYNAANISAAIAIGHYFKVSDNKIKEAIEAYSPANNRSQLLEKNGNQIILDAYNANPSSMEAALDNLLRLDTENKIAILGDMFELGVESAEEHRKLVQFIADKTTIQTHFIGKDFYSAKADSPHMKFHSDYNEFSSSFSLKSEGNTILVKGSRGMALERALELL